jgi:hypothetical protein
LSVTPLKKNPIARKYKEFGRLGNIKKYDDFIEILNIIQATELFICFCVFEPYQESGQALYLKLRNTLGINVRSS